MFLDRYANRPGTRVALDLINRLAVAPEDPAAAAESVFTFDPESVADRPADHVAGLTRLAQRLERVVTALDAGDTDTAAGDLNELLAEAPALPHLVRDEDGWSLHHHPRNAGLVEAWTSLCAEALARIVGDGYADRVHRCAAQDCGRAFVDTTKNGARRFCSERCQNRVKAAALRRRRATGTGQHVR